MADELGSAVLRIEVDTSAFLEALKKVKKTSESFTVDFTGVTKGLDALVREVGVAEKRVQTFNQVLSQAPGGSYDKITAQINKLTNATKTLNFNSEDYLNTLTRIRELEFLRGARAGRQRAVAGEAAFSGPTLTTGFGAPGRLPSLPNTIAGDIQLLSELNTRLQNTNRTSAAYEITLREVEAVQKRLQESLRGTTSSYKNLEQQENAALRRAEKLKNIQEYYSTKVPRSGGFRDPATGAMLARGQGTVADEAAFKKAEEARLRAERLAAEKSAREQRRRLQEKERLELESVRRVARTRAAQERTQRLSSTLIGGAFPLLFGQGIGAAAGGAIGGAVGGGPLGFGLSLVGTALGAAFDIAIQKASALAAALDDPIASFDVLVQNASLSSKAIERYAKALIESGRTAEAAAVIRGDILDTFGSLQGAEQYRTAVDELNRAWSEATTVLGQFVAGPLAAFIKQLSAPTTNFGLGVRFEQLAGALTPQQLVQVRAVRERATEASRLSRGGVSSILPPSEGDIAAGYRAGITEAERLLGVEEQRKQVADEIYKQTQRNNELQKTSLEVIQAAASRDQLRSLEAKKRLIALQKANELDSLAVKAAAPEREAIQIKYKKEELQLEQELTKEIQRRALLSTQINQARGAFGRSEAATAAINAALSVQDTINQFGPASLEVQLALQEGANSILDATQAGAERLRDAIRGFRDLQLGNLRFLPQEQRQQLIQSELQRGLPEAQRRGVALRGLEDLFAFNKFIEQETASRQQVADAQRNMADANAALNSNLILNTGAAGKLAEVMNRLVDKSWTVYVQAPGQNVATAINLQAQLGS